MVAAVRAGVCLYCDGTTQSKKAELSLNGRQAAGVWNHLAVEIESRSSSFWGGEVNETISTVIREFCGFAQGF